MKHADIFHGILNYLYKFPLNGEEIDLRKELNKPKYNIYNSLDGRNAYARLQVVIEYLQNKNYIEFNQRHNLIHSKNEIPVYVSVHKYYYKRC